MGGRRFDDVPTADGACWSVLLTLLVLVACSAPSRHQVAAYDPNECREALGMQTGIIPDEALTASSSLNPATLGTNSSRIRLEIGDGAWCPAQTIATDVYEWLQVDLGSLHIITMVETQGRFGHGMGHEFVEQYVLEYRRMPAGPWFTFNNRRGTPVLQGNTNNYNTEMRETDPPIIARWLRFVPHSVRPRAVCLRVEVYGCVWRDGLVSYDAPQGDVYGAEVDLSDKTYDGESVDGMLLGGMGQLTDGVEGNSNFRQEGVISKRGYDWIGWKNDSRHRQGSTIDLVFHFDTVRNFSALSLYVNNQVKREVRVFKMALIYFSIGGLTFEPEPIRFTPVRDVTSENARHVTLPLEQRIARVVRVELHFDSRWMLLGEVHFDSEVAEGSFPEEVSTSISSPASHGEGQDDDVYEGDEVASQSNDSTHDTPSPPSNKQTADRDSQVTGIILGLAIATFCLIIGAIVAVLLRRRQKRRYLKHKQERRQIFVEHGASLRNGVKPSASVVTGNGMTFTPLTAVMMDGGSRETDSLFSPTTNFSYRNLTGDTKSRRTLPPVPPNHLPPPPHPPSSSSALPMNDNMGDYSPPWTSLFTTATDDEAEAEGPYASCDVTNLPGLSVETRTFFTPDTLPQPQSQSQQLPGLVSSASSGGLSSAPTAGRQPPSRAGSVAAFRRWSVYPEDLVAMEIARDKLAFVEKIGTGRFGELHLCELAPDKTLCPGDSDEADGPRTVAVKLLHNVTSAASRREFVSEVQLMTSLVDPGLTRVLGVCVSVEPACVVFEYPEYGDLHTFLRQHWPEESATMTRRRQNKTLSHGCLVYMAAQVACALAYLESLGLVHRDVAARNCLLGPHYSVKLSNFGIVIDAFRADYAPLPNSAVTVPLRWMAWESILLGKYSFKSDVWSLGVLLWEMVTFGRQRPYADLADDQVMANCRRQATEGSGQAVYPACPEHCPRETYDLMRTCWQRDDVTRPSADEIQLFLSQKSVGFDPATASNRL